MSLALQMDSLPTKPSGKHLVDMSLSKSWEIVKDRVALCAICSTWCHKESDTTERLQTTTLARTRYILPSEASLCLLIQDWNEVYSEEMGLT